MNANKLKLILEESEFQKQLALEKRDSSLNKKHGGNYKAKFANGESGREIIDISI